MTPPPSRARRWVARLLVLPWAYCATALALFLGAQVVPEGAAPGWAISAGWFALGGLFFPPAILASVWGREELGARWLQADAALLGLGLLVGATQIGPPTGPSVVLGAALVSILVAPPLLAARLFLKAAAADG
jgi:peptidoglycan/LPS O-acetylase OafA/YrhL